MTDSNIIPKENWSVLSETDNTVFFKSKRHEVAFYFKNFNPGFHAYLGIRKIHLVDKKKARLLKKEYLKVFTPDANINSDEIPSLNYSEITKDIESAFKIITGGLL